MLLYASYVSVFVCLFKLESKSAWCLNGHWNLKNCMVCYRVKLVLEDRVLCDRILKNNSISSKILNKIDCILQLFDVQLWEAPSGHNLRPCIEPTNKYKGLSFFPDCLVFSSRISHSWQWKEIWWMKDYREKDSNFLLTIFNNVLGLVYKYTNLTIFVWTKCFFGHFIFPYPLLQLC